MSDKINITVLVAPLDWGLGHATRCIPIISELINIGCKVIVATDGPQENLLKTEFPNLHFVKLPGYRIRYASTKRRFTLKIISQLPIIFRAIRKENKWLANFLKTNPVQAIISDNRYGLYHNEVESVFITHQLLVKAPFRLLEQLLQKTNYQFLSKFNRCWVPDDSGEINMAGRLSHPRMLPPIPTQYIGGLSRLERPVQEKLKYDLMFVISGPEPQRTLLEQIAMRELLHFTGTALIVRGLPGRNDIITANRNITIKNHLSAIDMATAFVASDLVISRSGYTTVMDICKLQKKAVLIPTPGQTEQEYLATHLHKQGWCMTMNQDEFSLQKMQRLLHNFEFSIPHLTMDTYKTIVNSFITQLQG